MIILVALTSILAMQVPSPPAEESARLVERALTLLKADRFDEAFDVAGSAVDRWPDSAPAHAAMGDALYRRGDFDDSERHYRRAIEIDPNNASGHFGVGRILRTLGRYGEAADAFSRAAALSPTTPKYLRVLANHLARREDVIGMLKRYLELVRQGPGQEDDATVGNVEAWLALLERMGDRPIDEMVKKEPCSVPMQVLKGQAFIRMTVAELGSQRFVFDTGATGLTISPRIAGRAKLPPIRPFTISGTGAARTETGDLVVVPEISLGDGVVIRNVPATVREPSGSEEGLVGPSLFSAFDITVDLKGRRLTLETPGAPGDAGPSKRGRAEPFRNVGGEIVITARVNGQPFNAMVDTGAVSTILGRSILSRVPGLEAVAPSGPMTRSLGIGGPMADRRVILKGAFSFAGRDYLADGLPSGALTGLSHALESEIYIILGSSHLDDTPFSIDYRGMTVTFLQR